MVYVVTFNQKVLTCCCFTSRDLGGRWGATLGLDLLRGLVSPPEAAAAAAVTFSLVAFGPQLVTRLTGRRFLMSSVAVGTSLVSGAVTFT